MPLLLRVDVDKPYGTYGLPRRIMSKLVEDYVFPRIRAIGYLKDLRGLLTVLRQYKVRGHIYFRNCTAPDPETLRLLRNDGHHIGFHAEDTRSRESFEAELELFRRRLDGSMVGSFTKHGSGSLKLGRHHWPPYEPERYKEWAEALSIRYFLGNGTVRDFDALPEAEEWIPDMFWMEAEYRDPEATEVARLVPLAGRSIVPVLIHPSNYVRREQVRVDFDRLLRQAAEEQIEWLVA